MNNIVAMILAEASGILRFRWYGLAFTWVVCLLGWIGVSVIPNTYESKAVLYIDTATVLSPLLADLAVNSNVMSEVRMMTEVLLSRPQLEHVIQDTDLHVRAETPEDMEQLLTLVRRRIQLSGSAPRNSYDEKNLYTIIYVDHDPQMAYTVVQSLLDSFVERSLGENRADSVGAQKFIEEQIEHYERRLADAEQQLAEFKKKNVGLMPSEGRDYYERLQLAVDELDRLKTNYNKIKSRRDELQKQIGGEEPTFGLLATPDNVATGGATSNDEIEAYEKELTTLLLKFTEKHPKVVDLRNRIAQMQVRQDELALQGETKPTYELDTELVNMNSLDLNPVYQSLRISISQANAELSEVNAQVVAAESRVSYLRRMVDTIPEIEAQLARLNRDYDVNKAQHMALLEKLESARLSEDAESRSDKILFRIIEPPVVPLEPTGPARKLFATVVLLAGFGLGGALAYLLHLINPVFSSVTDLRQSLQIPVLGSISLYRSEAAMRMHRKSNTKFRSAIAAILAFYVLALVFWPTAEFVKNAFGTARVFS